MEKKYTLGIIGAGNMASAIIGGIIKNSILPPTRIIVSDPDASKLASYEELGIASISDNRALSASCEYLLFAVKPQIAPAVWEEINDTISADTVVSIMAGISISKLENALGNRNYARIMPNTPALVGEGMAAVAFSNGYRSEFILDIFKSLGKVVELDENKFDAVTSLSGSGPAYVYLFIKSLIDGGTGGGLDYDTAKLLAVQTVIGTAKMAEESDKSLDELIDAVCSKGGTTIQAIDSFKSDGLEEIVKRGMEKCRLRSEELGK